MATIGVVGASGFVGRHLTRELVARGHSVRAIVRSASSGPKNYDEVALGDFTEVDDWAPALQGLDCVICLAARAHVIKETHTDTQAEYRRINTMTPVKIAHSAAESGIPRFVFLSSIGVNGETCHPDTPFTVDSVPNPTAPYAISKLEAEIALQRIHEMGSITVISVRSPLVYGGDAKGNFHRLLRLVGSGVPLPLASARNPRAMISIDNLCDALIQMLDVDRTDRMLAIVGDGESLSTASLIRQISSSANRPARLLPFPPVLLRFVLTAIGKKREAEKLLDPLVVSITATWPNFDWVPPRRARDEIAKASRSYASSTSRNRH